MARKTPGRKTLRKQVEAAAAKKSKTAKKTTKKKVAEKKTTKKKVAKKRAKKVKAVERKRLVWGVYSGNMKEEARFPYDELDKAEKKATQLRSKSSKLYFIQPIKEVIPEVAAEDDA